jgi:hypothetical protein
MATGPVGLHQYLDPFLGGTGTPLPEDVQLAFANLNQWVTRMEQAVPFVLFGAGLLVTCILWLFIQAHGRRLARNLELAGVEQPASSPEPAEWTVGAKSVEPAPVQQPGDTAVQVLALFQREGRLIDFLGKTSAAMTMLRSAAVRSIHEGCKRTLAEHLNCRRFYRK